MSTAAIIWIVLSSMGFATRLNNVGKPNAPLKFWQVLLGQMASIGLLYWGGFFSSGCDS